MAWGLGEILLLCESIGYHDRGAVSATTAKLHKNDAFPFADVARVLEQKKPGASYSLVV